MLPSPLSPLAPVDAPALLTPLRRAKRLALLGHPHPSSPVLLLWLKCCSLCSGDVRSATDFLFDAPAPPYVVACGVDGKIKSLRSIAFTIVRNPGCSMWCSPAVCLLVMYRSAAAWCYAPGSGHRFTMTRTLRSPAIRRTCSFHQHDDGYTLFVAYTASSQQFHHSSSGKTRKMRPPLAPCDVCSVGLLAVS